jgi:hypothetical protein
MKAFLNTSCLILASALTLFISCSKPNNSRKNIDESHNRIDLTGNLENRVEAFNLSDISDSIELIPLQLDPQHLFNEEDISNFEISADYIILYTSRSGILQYTRDGKFIRQVGHIGKGPGEYLLLRSMFIDPRQNTIYGFTNWTYKLLEYDFNGNFKRTIEPSYRHSSDFYRITKFGKYYLIHQKPSLIETADTNMVFNLAITDSLFNDIKELSEPGFLNRKQEILNNKYNPKDSWANFYGAPDPILNSQSNNLTLLHYTDNIIYSISQQLEIVPKYVIDIGTKVPFWLAHRRLKDPKYFEYLVINNFIETPGYLFIDFGCKEDNYKARFDKSTGKVDMLKEKGKIVEIIVKGRLYGRRREGKVPCFTNDINGMGQFCPQWCKEGCLMSITPAYRLAALPFDSIAAAHVVNPSSRNRLLTLARGGDRAGSPVLTLVHLK